MQAPMPKSCHLRTSLSCFTLRSAAHFACTSSSIASHGGKLTKHERCTVTLCPPDKYNGRTIMVLSYAPSLIQRSFGNVGLSADAQSD